jgi:hypothetical protein
MDRGHQISNNGFGNKCWEYINPETTKEKLPKLEEPDWPTPATVKAGAAGISGLNEDEKDEYKSLKKGYDRSVTKCESRRKGLGTMRIKIQETVTRSNL